LLSDCSENVLNHSRRFVRLDSSKGMEYFVIFGRRFQPNLTSCTALNFVGLLDEVIEIL
jgi:hypothetical protein